MYDLSNWFVLHRQQNNKRGGNRIKEEEEMLKSELSLGLDKGHFHILHVLSELLCAFFNGVNIVWISQSVPSYETLVVNSKTKPYFPDVSTNIGNHLFHNLILS